MLFPAHVAALLLGFFGVVALFLATVVSSRPRLPLFLEKLVRMMAERPEHWGQRVPPLDAANVLDILPEESVHMIRGPCPIPPTPESTEPGRRTPPGLITW